MTWKVVFFQRLRLLQKIYASPILFEEDHRRSPFVGQITVAQASCTYNSRMHLMLRDSFIYVAFWGLSLKHIFLWNLELKWIPLECSLKLYFKHISECKIAVKIPLTHWQFLRQCASHSTFFASQTIPFSPLWHLGKAEECLKKPLGDSHQTCMALGPVDDFFVCFCSLPSHSKEISEVLVREYKKFIFYLMGDNEDAYLTCLDFF